MSINRNKDEDRYNTSQMLNKDPEDFSGKNWLGHSGAAAKIDVMLLETACNTVEQMGLINTLCRGYYAGMSDFHTLGKDWMWQKAICMSPVSSSKKNFCNPSNKAP